MDSKVAQRRLKAIHSHFITADDSPSLLGPNPTAGEFVSEQGCSVVLPEKLQTGKWNVYRSARSPLKLVSRFPDHPEIATLHDNFVHAVDTFRDYKYLGTRIRVDGTVGEYKWMTYGEAGTARSGIGSGLTYHGIPKGSSIGLYFINRPEWLIIDHACSAYSYVSVPLYDTLGPDALARQTLKLWQQRRRRRQGRKQRDARTCCSEYLGREFERDRKIEKPSDRSKSRPLPNPILLVLRRVDRSLARQTLKLWQQRRRRRQGRRLER